MYHLTRLSLKNWYLCDHEDVEFQGSVGILGATGAGKSSLLDAIQTVISGLNHRRISLNASAETRSDRKVIDYCLGYLAPKKDGGIPKRQSCESIIALTFTTEKPDGSLHHVSVGVVMEADEDAAREHVVTRFIAPGVPTRTSDWIATDEEGEYLKDWGDIVVDLKERCPELREYRSSAEKFVTDMLAIMRLGADQPNANRFLNAFFNALEFRPINDSTQFVRNFILESDPLNIDRVRGQVDRWREFTEAAKLIEKKLDTLKSITNIYDRWGRLVLDKLALRMRVASAEIRIARLDLGNRAEALRQVNAELDDAGREQVRLTKMIETLEEDYTAKRDILNARGVTSRLEGIEAKVQICIRDMQDAERIVPELKKTLQAVSGLETVRSAIPGSFVPAISSAKDALAIIQSNPGLKWVETDRAAIQGHLGTISILKDLPERLKLPIEAVESDLHELRARRKVLDENVRRAGTGVSPLSGYTQAFIRLLSENGISGVPVCDVVDVADESWQFAVESVLGLRREAVIVAPEDCRRAHDILYRHRNDMQGMRNCRLVKTTETGKSDSRVRDGSIVEVLTTDNHHAETYLNFHLRGIMKADNENDLARHRNAVMKNGKAAGGMDYQVHPDRGVRLIIGKNSQSAAAESDRKELSEVEGDIASKKRELDTLKQIEVIADGASSFEIDLDTLSDTITDIERNMRSLEEQKQAVIAEFDDGLKEEVDNIVADLNDAKREIKINQREIESIRDKRVRAEGSYADARKKTKVALAKKRDAKAAFETKEAQVLIKFVPQLEGRSYFGWMDPFVGKNIEFKERPESEAMAFFKAELDSSRTRLDAHSDKEHGRLASSGRANLLDKYCRTYNIEFAHSDLENTPFHDDYVWAILQRNRLQNHELREHLDNVVIAEKEMVSAIKEDLLSRLSDKFKKMDQQIRTLNSYLRKRKFTGGQVYKFSKRPDPTLDRVRKLALEVADNPDNANAIIEKRHHDPEMVQAMVDLESYIDDTGGVGLEDYRNYFSFDMYMVPEEQADEDVENIQNKMSLSGRSGVGSGGETQAPLYVAMAASMAMAYFPGGHPKRSGPTGMGLVVFDEAFAKLDVSNTQALIQFFKDFNLQLIVAAPESERATFTEVFDTITTVTKSSATKSVYIASDFPKEYARAELAAINPNHLTVEDFRQDLIEMTAD